MKRERLTSGEKHGQQFELTCAPLFRKNAQSRSTPQS